MLPEAGGLEKQKIRLNAGRAGGVYLRVPFLMDKNGFCPFTMRLQMISQA